MKKDDEGNEPSWVRLAGGEKRFFPTATRMRETRDGGVEVWNDRIYLAGFKSEEHAGYWLNPARGVAPAQVVTRALTTGRKASKPISRPRSLRGRRT